MNHYGLCINPICTSRKSATIYAEISGYGCVRIHIGGAWSNQYGGTIVSAIATISSIYVEHIPDFVRLLQAYSHPHVTCSVL
jgi:hypothetical protein